jgi:catechol 2,3-dioxygenase-like lactoylglutathione lyase family enzyme
MALMLFAGISVHDISAAIPWYTRLFGGPPSFLPNDVEAVWELAENRSVYIEERPQHAGHSHHTAFLDDLDAFVDAAVGRGVEPTLRETYENGVRKVTFTDPDGNEVGFGGGPPDVNTSDAAG